MAETSACTTTTSCASATRRTGTARRDGSGHGGESGCRSLGCTSNVERQTSNVRSPSSSAELVSDGYLYIQGARGDECARRGLLLYDSMPAHAGVLLRRKPLPAIPGVPSRPCPPG